jgi:hypothetical protein
VAAPVHFEENVWSDARLPFPQVEWS